MSYPKLYEAGMWLRREISVHWSRGENSFSSPRVSLLTKLYRLNDILLDGQGMADAPVGYVEMVEFYLELIEEVKKEM